MQRLKQNRIRSWTSLAFTGERRACAALNRALPGVFAAAGDATRAGVGRPGEAPGALKLHSGSAAAASASTCAAVGVAASTPGHMQ